MKNNKIGENIKRIRIEKGLTQKQLGQLCVPAVADSTIRRYEAGTLKPKIETQFKIAEALEVPWAEVAGIDTQDLMKSGMRINDDTSSPSEYGILTYTEEKIIFFYRYLNTFGRSRVLSTIKNLLTKDRYTTMFSADGKPINLLDGVVLDESSWGSEDSPFNKRDPHTKELKKYDNLINYFDQLSPTGQQVAVERIEELTHIEKYTRKETEEE